MYEETYLIELGANVHWSVSIPGGCIDVCSVKNELLYYGSLSLFASLRMLSFNLHLKRQNY